MAGDIDGNVTEGWCKHGDDKDNDGDDEDDASHDKATEPTELPEAKPPIDNGQINAEIDLPIECTGLPNI